MATNKEKDKPLFVDIETHKMAKEQAHQAGMTLKGYIRLCVVQCKSDKKAR